MTSIHKFQFDLFMDPPAVLAEDFSLPPEPLFTRAQNQEATRQGYDDGYAQGEKDGLEREKTSRDAALHALLVQISAQIQTSFDEIERDKGKMIHQTIVFVRHIFEKIFPVFEKYLGAEQAQKLIQEVVQTQSPPSLKIIVHPDLQPLLQAQTQKMQLPCALTFETNQQFDLSNCRLEWQDSGVERAVSQIVSEIENLLKGFENVFEDSNESSDQDETEH